MDPLDEQLILAAARGDTKAVLHWLDQGASINAVDSRGRTPIMSAVYGNHIQTVAELLQAGADINLRDDMLNNPFLYAGAEGYLEILRLAIEARADTSITNRYGGTALIPACERGHIEIARELLSRTDVDINHINNLGWTALMEAIVLGDGNLTQQRIVKLLVDYGADIQIADKDGVTPLEHARKNGFQEIERILCPPGSTKAVVPDDAVR